MKTTQQPAQGRKSEDKGFYIILVLCLAAIAVSAYVLFWTPSDVPTDAQQEPVTTPVMQSSDNETDEPEPEETPSTTQTEPPKTQTPSTQPSQETFGKSKDNDDALVLPIKHANVLKVFSQDTLQYDVTMGDWRVHQATDYAGAVGDRVYAVGSGTVSKVEKDALYGNCVILKLANDLTCRYTGLSDKIKVKEGDAVKAGTLLGAIGNSNQMESEMDSHLHLEMYRGDQHIDPEEVLPQKEE